MSASIFDQFEGKRILVLGDVMIDAYMLGRVSRISPEAPVPIVSLENEDERLGGAANVALNLASLGALPVICSVVGNDVNGTKLVDLLGQAGISADGVVFSDQRKTTVKMRIIGNNQQLLRVDAEQTNDIAADEEKMLRDKILSLLPHADALIFEDYNKGTLTESLIRDVIAACKQQGVITTVDPKKKNFFAYQGVTLFKPNLKEMIEGLQISGARPGTPAFTDAVQLLRERLQHDITFITLSEHGVYIRQEDEFHHIPAHVRNIADVSGAGDTVISVATLCLCLGLPIEQIATISNLAGGLVCEKSGVVSISRHELESELERIYLD